MNETEGAGAALASESLAPMTKVASEEGKVVTRVPDFAQLQAAPGGAVLASLDQLLDMNVIVTAELGRISLLIGDVLKLSVGAVLKLDRMVAEPVDLMVQGKRLARGEVVVVDDRFAIRVKELAETKKKF